MNTSLLIINMSGDTNIELHGLFDFDATIGQGVEYQSSRLRPWQSLSDEGDKEFNSEKYVLNVDEDRVFMLKRDENNTYSRIIQNRDAVLRTLGHHFTITMTPDERRNILVELAKNHLKTGDSFDFEPALYTFVRESEGELFFIIYDKEIRKNIQNILFKERSSFRC